LLRVPPATTATTRASTPGAVCVGGVRGLYRQQKGEAKVGAVWGSAVPLRAVLPPGTHFRGKSMGKRQEVTFGGRKQVISL